jgi:hypothetical protein
VLGRVEVEPGYWIRLQPSGFVTPYPCSNKQNRCPGTNGVLALPLNTDGVAIDQCGAVRDPSSNNVMCGSCLAPLQDVRGVCTSCDSSISYLLLLLFLAFSFVFILHLFESRQNNTGELSVILYFTQVCEARRGVRGVGGSF